MSTDTQLLSQQELAQRWGRSEAAIGQASAMGAGPRHVQIGSLLMYPRDEVQRYERACLFHDPAEVALHDLH